MSTATLVMSRGRDDASSRNASASSSISGSMRGLPFLKPLERKRFLATLRPTCSRSTASLRTSRTNLSTLDCIAAQAAASSEPPASSARPRTAFFSSSNARTCPLRSTFLLRANTTRVSFFFPPKWRRRSSGMRMVSS